MRSLAPLQIWHTFSALVAAACWLALMGLSGLPAIGQSTAERALVAGPAIVLKHPPINDSIGNPVHCLTFLEDGKSLATGATSGVLIWEVASGDLRQTLAVDSRAVDSLALAPRSDLLVAGGATGIIKVWDRGLKPVHSLGPTPGSVRGLAISPDGKLLASASPLGQKGPADREFAIAIWDLALGEQVRSVLHPPSEFGVTALAFLPSGKQLITAQDRTLRLVDALEGNILKTVNLPDLPRSFGSLALPPDGRLLATGVFEPKLRLWNTQSWTQVSVWNAHDQLPPPRSGVASVNYSPDGKYLLSGGMDGMACVWDAASGARLLELDARGEGSGKWITGVAMSPGSDWLAAAHFGGTATLWRIELKQ